MTKVKKLGWALMLPVIVVAIWGQFFSSYSAPWWAVISVTLLASTGASIGALVQSQTGGSPKSSGH